MVYFALIYFVKNLLEYPFSTQLFHLILRALASGLLCRRFKLIILSVHHQPWERFLNSFFLPDLCHVLLFYFKFIRNPLPVCFSVIPLLCSFFPLLLSCSMAVPFHKFLLNTLYLDKDKRTTLNIKVNISYIYWHCSQIGLLPFLRASLVLSFK